MDSLAVSAAAGRPGGAGDGFTNPVADGDTDDEAFEHENKTRATST